jgi:hypothetical protein
MNRVGISAYGFRDNMSLRSIYYWTDGNPWHLETANRLLMAFMKAFGWGGDAK